MQKKPIIIISVLCVISLVLGYLSGLKDEESLSNGDAETKTKKEPEFLKEGLVAYYPFNGNAKDESGNGNDGEIRGAKLVEDRYGIAARAFNYPDDGSILIKDHTSLRPGLITLSAWVSPVSNQASNVLWKQQVPGDLYEQYWLSLNAKNRRHGAGAGPIIDPSTIDFAIKRNSKGRAGHDWWRPLVTKSISTNKWSHIVCTWDGKEQNVYLNGELVGVAKDTPDGEIDDIPGGDITIKGTTSDDIRIYNRALSAEEVKALHDFEKAE